MSNRLMVRGHLQLHGSHPTLVNRSGRGVLTASVSLLEEPIHPKTSSQNLPHVSHLIAAFCADFGYHPSIVIPYLNTLRRAERGGNPFFRGSAATFARPFYSNLVKRVEEFMEIAEERKTFTPLQLANTMGLEVDGEGRFIVLGTINNALAILEMCGGVIKLPKKSGIGAQYVYVHKIHKGDPSTIPNWNIRFNLLVAVYRARSEGIRLSDVIRTTRAFGRTIGTDDGLGSSAGASKALNALVRDGLLIAEKVISGSAHYIKYTLNPESSWLKLAIRKATRPANPILSDRLRRSILGEHDENSMNIFQTTHFRLIRNIKILRLREQGHSYGQIAHLFEVTKKNIRIICESEHLISAKISKEVLERHLEAMKRTVSTSADSKIHPTHADVEYFKRYLSTHFE